jgi:hypothetical protein
MKKTSRNLPRIPVLLAGTGVLMVALGCASEANARCGQLPGLKPASYRWAPESTGGGSSYLLPAMFQAIADSDPGEARFSNYAIVGVWKYQLLSKGVKGLQDGTVLDFGYQSWGADGTEIMNSGSRPPATGYICTGVWERVSYHHYKLNHFAWGWDKSGTVFLGPTVIKEDVEADEAGNHFSGTVQIIQYETDGKTVSGDIVTGTVTGDRASAD